MTIWQINFWIDSWCLGKNTLFEYCFNFSGFNKLSNPILENERDKSGWVYSWRKNRKTLILVRVAVNCLEELGDFLDIAVPGLVRKVLQQEDEGFLLPVDQGEEAFLLPHHVIPLSPDGVGLPGEQSRRSVVLGSCQLRGGESAEVPGPSAPPPLTLEVSFFKHLLQPKELETSNSRALNLNLSILSNFLLCILKSDVIKAIRVEEEESVHQEVSVRKSGDRKAEHKGNLPIFILVDNFREQFVDAHSAAEVYAEVLVGVLSRLWQF